MKRIIAQPDHVPQPERRPAGVLRAFALDNERLVFLPSCARCGKPILDFEHANIVVTSESGFALPDSSRHIVVDGHELDPINGEVIAVHHECDWPHEDPWAPFAFVLRELKHVVKELKRVRRRARAINTKSPSISI